MLMHAIGREPTTLGASESSGKLIKQISWARLPAFMSQQSRMGPESFISTKFSGNADAADQGTTLENHHTEGQQGPILLETWSQLNSCYSCWPFMADAALPLPSAHSPFLPSNRNLILLEVAMFSLLSILTSSS